jgi:hypothetical protein
MKEFGKHFMKLDPAFWYVAVAFLIACIYPVFSLRDDILGKSFMVAIIIAMTLYNRIAGIVALILVIALLNRDRGIMEGFGMDGLGSSGSGTLDSNPLFGSTATAAPTTPDQFRQQYCTNGVTDPISPPEKFISILSPTLFTDNQGKPQANSDFLNVAKQINFASMNSCTPENPGSNNFATVQNMCDPNCNWTMNPAPTPTASTTTNPTTNPTTEGFNANPMSALRPHIRAGRHLVTDSMDNVKSVANRLKRQLF